MAQPFVEPCSRGVVAAEPCPQELGREIAPERRRMVLAACVLASSMAFIDGSALTVALPKLRADLGADLASVQWVINGYVLALASLTLIGGALADVYGKARMLQLGCLLFGVASAACALAPSVGWLIAARVVQGIAAAIVTPASLALIGATYPKGERSRAIGVWAAASALTTAAGPVLGGWLTEAYGWQLVFWMNPPLALAAVWLLAAYAPAGSPRGTPVRYDRRRNSGCRARRPRVGDEPDRLGRGAADDGGAYLRCPLRPSPAPLPSAASDSRPMLGGSEPARIL